MKKKLLILSASIGFLLACFPFTLCAEEDPESNLGVSPPPAYYQLDSYFYENYESYPYIESDGTQYIDSGIKAKDNLRINITFSDLENATAHLFGSRVGYGNDALCVGLTSGSTGATLSFEDANYFYSHSLSDPYLYYNLIFDNNSVYLNGTNIHDFTASDFNNNLNMFIFGCNNNGSAAFKSSYKLYNFSIYDYDSDEYVRYFYPAKSISSGTIGLYDAVSKTFFTSLSGSAFSEPSGNIAEAGIVSNIGNFIYNGLGWIDDILSFAITEPVIIFFMAIGLAGAMFRWSRKLVHF